jgi:hypothetical protein
MVNKSEQVPFLVDGVDFVGGLATTVLAMSDFFEFVIIQGVEIGIF